MLNTMLLNILCQQIAFIKNIDCLFNANLRNVVTRNSSQATMMLSLIQSMKCKDRQMSGGNYYVSVNQIYKVEKKMRVKSYLGLKSAKFGKITFNPENFEEIDNDVVDEQESQVGLKFLQIIETDYLNTAEIDEDLLLYIAGYAAFKLSAKVCCSTCRIIIVSNEIPDSNYFNELNRGGLTVPSKTVMMVAKHVLCITNVLISEEYEREFLKIGQQRALIRSLAEKGIQHKEGRLNHKFRDQCLCGADMRAIFRKMLTTFVNICLNNYTKMKNDALKMITPKPKEKNQAEGAMKSGKKRKLQTLEKVRTYS